MTAIPNIRQLAQSDVPKAKVELGKHVEEIVLKPNSDRSAYLLKHNGIFIGKERFQPR